MEIKTGLITGSNCSVRKPHKLGGRKMKKEQGVKR